MEELDYYRYGAGGVLAEEFVRGRDHTTVGLRSALWTGDGWRSAASFSRRVRTDPAVLAAVTPTDRAGAGAALRELGGGPLPDEAALRDQFGGYEAFAVVPPLRLGPAEPPDGFHERRIYRVLFAKELTVDRFEGHREAGDDRFAWTLRRVGNGIAWALDVTVLLAAGADHTVRPMLRELTSAVRKQGLIPVLTERFA
nr:hypothetical protein [uncultured Actinoplanes sp.]